MVEKTPKWLWGVALGGTVLIGVLAAHLALTPPELSSEAIRYHVKRARQGKF